jgi:hypothetical protein
MMDDFETALIRQWQESIHTPIIISAINASESHASRDYSLRVVDYIFTPVNTDILPCKVNVFIDLFVRPSRSNARGNDYELRPLAARANCIRS